MLEGIARNLNTAVGVKTVIDFGEIYNQDQGHNVVTIKLSIEHYQSSYYLRMAVTHSRGMSRKTRVIKWPYSQTDTKDLALVMRDIQKVSCAKVCVTGELIDGRTRIGRWFDKLIGRNYYGYYEFISPISQEKKVTVYAEIADSGKDTLVTLIEKKSGHGFILAHVPFDAIKVIELTLQDYFRDEVLADGTGS